MVGVLCVEHGKKFSMRFRVLNLGFRAFPVTLASQWGIFLGVFVDRGRDTQTAAPRLGEELSHLTTMEQLQDNKDLKEWIGHPLQPQTVQWPFLAALLESTEGDNMTVRTHSAIWVNQAGS